MSPRGFYMGLKSNTVYIIYIRPLGGVEKQFLQNCSRGSRAPPHGQINPGI